MPFEFLLQPKIVKHTETFRDKNHFPRPLLAYISGSSVRPNKYIHWWRAISTAYIIRLNERTLAAIEERKRHIYPFGNVPVGTIAVHIRRGDKWREDVPIHDSQWADVLESLYKRHQREWGLRKSVFLSTEDESTVNFFRNLSGWNVSYTQVQRFTDKELSPMQIAIKIGKVNEVLNSLVSLDLSLQCDAFLLALSSNWCRLIDELRSTVRCKAGNPLMDPQQDNFLADYDLGW